MPDSLGDAASRDAALTAVNKWYSLLAGRRDLLQPWAQTAATGQEEDKGEAFSEVAVLPAALMGVEWLRFACRLLLVLAKHAAGEFQAAAACKQQQSAAETLRQLQRAIASLPVTKHSDLRNSFLRLVERAAGVSPGNFVDGTPRSTSPAANQDLEAGRLATTCEALWRGGLRLGAALELDPWVALLSEEEGFVNTSRLIVA